jgi:hypothetical protein
MFGALYNVFKTTTNFCEAGTTVECTNGQMAKVSGNVLGQEWTIAIGQPAATGGESDESDFCSLPHHVDCL